MAAILLCDAYPRPPVACRTAMKGMNLVGNGDLLATYYQRPIIWGVSGPVGTIVSTCLQVDG